MSACAIGISTAIERVSWGPWEETATMLPRSYAAAVQRAGALALLLPPDDAVAEAPDSLLDLIDGLILAGGSDIDPASYGAEPHPETTETRPERDRFEISLARSALDHEVPLLGVCRGMQLLNVAGGGTLVQHLPEALEHDEHRPTPGTFTDHDVRLEAGSLAARAAGDERVSVKSHHHQGIDRLGAGLVASGWSGPEELVEAIEAPGHSFALGVLWHPEEDERDRVIGALVEAARAEVTA